MRYLHSMIRVGDLDAALDFFCNKLGLIKISQRDDEKGRFSLIFLAAPDDLDAARGQGAPMVELTHNWDEKEYGGGRNFGHLAYQVDDIYALCAKLQDKRVTINRPTGAWRSCARRTAFRSSCCKRAQRWRRPSLGLRCRTRAPGDAEDGDA